MAIWAGLAVQVWEPQELPPGPGSQGHTIWPWEELPHGAGPCLASRPHLGRGVRELGLSCFASFSQICDRKNLV